MSTEFKSAKAPKSRRASKTTRTENTKSQLRTIARAGLLTQVDDHQKKFIKSLPESKPPVNKTANFIPSRKPPSPQSSSPRYLSSLPSGKTYSPSLSSPRNLPSPVPLGNPSSPPSFSARHLPSSLHSGQPSLPPSSSPKSLPFSLPLGKPFSLPSSSPRHLPSSLPLGNPSSPPSSPPRYFPYSSSSGKHSPSLLSSGIRSYSSKQQHYSPSTLPPGKPLSQTSPSVKSSPSPNRSSFPASLGKPSSYDISPDQSPSPPLTRGKRSSSPKHCLSSSEKLSSPIGKLTSPICAPPASLPVRPNSPPPHSTNHISSPTKSPYSSAAKPPLTNTTTAPKKTQATHLVKPSLTTNSESGSTSKQKIPTIKLVQRVALSKPKVVISREEIDQLTSKFEKLSVAIVQLATSNCPVSVRSLESLLTKEVEDCLGPEVNCAKFAELFVRESRLLLNSLNCEYEEGKVNTQLIKGHKGTKRRFLKSNPETTICYRDRYLKELVMNALQGMCSDQVEEDVSAVAKVRTRESQARISALRDLVRAEAGLDPEVFKRGQQRLAELQRTLSRNHLEVLSATREIEAIISEQRLACLDVNIPKAARKILMGSENSTRQASAECEKGAKCGVGCSDKPSSSKCCDDVSKNCAEEIRECENNRENASLLERKSDSCKGGCETRENFDRTRQRSGSTLKDEPPQKDPDRSQVEVPLRDWPASSTESVLSKTALCEHSDDEINEEETLMFLQALNSDIEHNRRVVHGLLFSNCLEKVDEGCEGDFDPGLDKACKDSFENNLDVGGNSCSTTVDSIQMLKKVSENGSFLTRQPSGGLSDTPKLKNDFLPESENDSPSSPDVDKTLENTVPSVKSRWWSPDDSIAKEIVSEIEKAFSVFRKVFEMNDDTFSDIERDGDQKPTVRNGDYDFTVEETAIILMKLSNKIQHLPETFEKHNATGPDSYSHLTIGQQYKILQTVANVDCFLGDYYSRSDDLKNVNEDDSFLIKAKKVSLAFSFLARVLSHAPPHLRTQPVSALVPPESLIKTMAVFASIEYFKDCFIWGLIEASRSKSSLTSFDEVFAKVSTEYLKNDGKNCETQETLTQRDNKSFEVIKPVYLEEQTSSGEMIRIVSSLDIRRASARLAEKPGQIEKNVSSYEDYMGLSASEMTVQNVSDMFVFLSTVLNDVPDRIKSEKIVDLDPPPSLLAALSVLYLADDEDSLILENTLSFSSLSVQDASDFFLTLARTFENIPERLRSSLVKELDPPQSLMKAVSLLTSVSYDRILKSGSSGDVSEAVSGDVGEDLSGDVSEGGSEETTDSQEQFYDAQESVPL